MPHAKTLITVDGNVTEVFSHRFVVETSKGKILADIGGHNKEKVIVKTGDTVELVGEQKPSELKVKKLVLNGQVIVLADKPKHHGHEPADPQIAFRTAKNENITVIGQPQRKPKHFELLGRNIEGKLVELHIELDGALRKQKPVEANDVKWAKELFTA